MNFIKRTVAARGPAANDIRQSVDPGGALHVPEPSSLSCDVGHTH
jgi:hypothetical protein